MVPTGHADGAKIKSEAKKKIKNEETDGRRHQGASKLQAAAPALPWERFYFGKEKGRREPRCCLKHRLQDQQN